MKSLNLLILLLFSNIAFTQSCVVKLIDSYSYKEINIDASIKVNAKKFKIDTVNNFIEFENTPTKIVKIELKNYKTYENKLPEKNKTNDSIRIELEPSDSMISINFEALWHPKVELLDTMYFESMRALMNQTFYYINYLKPLNKYCIKDSFSCSPTYRYIFRFKKVNSLYQIYNVNEVLSPQIHCEELDNYFWKIKNIFPKFYMIHPMETITITITYTLD
jgi:hypothetical protein